MRLESQIKSYRISTLLDKQREEAGGRNKLIKNSSGFATLEVDNSPREGSASKRRVLCPAARRAATLIRVCLVIIDDHA